MNAQDFHGWWFGDGSPPPPPRPPRRRRVPPPRRPADLRRVRWLVAYDCPRCGLERQWRYRRCGHCGGGPDDLPTIDHYAQPGPRPAGWHRPRWRRCPLFGLHHRHEWLCARTWYDCPGEPSEAPG